MNIFNSNGYIIQMFFTELEQKSQKEKKRADEYLSAISEGIRYNTLLSVARAGTGHLGASLSMIELLTEIYFRSFAFSPACHPELVSGSQIKMKGIPKQVRNDNHRDVFILSKGHGAPGLYATLAAKGYFPVEQLDRLRRLDGLAGHCDIETPGIEANTGSLAMGLSKAVGYAITKKRLKQRGSVIVIVGDAEIQEGQCWEAFLSAVSFACDNLSIIIDDNEVQTDQYTRDIVRYGNLIGAIESIGFEVGEGMGETVPSVHKLLKKGKKLKGKPKLFWFHTKKGQGVSFMEYQNVLTDGTKRYMWHNKAPNKEELEKALGEVWKRIEQYTNFKFQISNFNSNSRKDITNSLNGLRLPIEPMQKDINGESVLQGFSEGLMELAKKEKNLVVLDADLEEDCGFSLFREKYPERFFEMGIMEQHMVSVATAMSRSGLLPVFASYAAFLTSRANEQLYNLATENARAIIVGNMAGVIPATPGKSHAGFRDIALMKNIPGITMYQPITSDDAKQSLQRYVRGELGRLLYIRLSLAPSAIHLPSPPRDLPYGRPHILRPGTHAVLVGIGPVVLGECLRAADRLSKEGLEIEIWNHTWVIAFDPQALKNVSKRNIPVIIIEDHYKRGGFGESFISSLQYAGADMLSVKHMALDEMPTTGFRDEILDRYCLSQNHIKSAVQSLVRTHTRNV